MVIEGNEDKRRRHLANPQSTQMMKVSRAQEGERRQTWPDLSLESLDESGWRAVTELLAPRAAMEVPRLRQRVGRPGPVKIDDLAGAAFHTLLSAY